MLVGLHIKQAVRREKQQDKFYINVVKMYT